MTIQNLREDRRPADLWFWNDWFASFDLRNCSLAARGLWMDMLGISHRAAIRGTLAINGNKVDGKTMAKISGTSIEEIERLWQELESNNVFSRLPDGTIINRRMYRQSEIRKSRARAGEKGAFSRWQNDSRKNSKALTPVNGKAITELENEYENANIKGGVGGDLKFEARHLSLAEFLESKIKENVPHHKITGKRYVESWAREFRLMEESDKVPFDTLKAVLAWSQDDAFWKINILSASKFREKFGRLEAKMRGQSESAGRKTPDMRVGSNKDPRYRALAEKYIGEDTTKGGQS